MKEVEEVYEVEEMDLTEDFGEMCSPKHRLVAPVAGRKRKSDEVELDARGRSSSTDQSGVSTKQTVLRLSEEFPSIDELEDEDEDTPAKGQTAPPDPPPPYSTIPPRPKALARSPTPGARVDDRGAVSTTCIQDSEDEEELVDFSDRKREIISLENNATPMKPKYISTEVTGSSHVQKELHAKALTSSLPNASRNVTTPQPPPSAGTQTSSPESQLLLNLFKSPDTVFEQALQPVEQRADILADKIANSYDSGADNPYELESELERLHERKLAIIQLKERRTGYRTLQERRERTVEAMKMALRARQGQQEAIATNAAAKQRMEEYERECLDFLRSCEDDIRATLDRVAINAHKVAVHSTQAEPGATNGNIPVMHSSSRIAQTQVQPPMAPPDKDRRPNFSKTATRDEDSRVTSDNSTTMRDSMMFDEDAFDDDIEDHDMYEPRKPTYSHRMGTPPDRFDIQDAYQGDDDFGGDYDEDMLDVVTNFEQAGQSSTFTSTAPPRQFFAEISGNTQAKSTSASKSKKVTTAQSQAIALEEFNRKNMMYPWSKDVRDALEHRFLLRGFRENQCEAINETLSGRDVFVLMPTGGGKSLCYQLPAVISSGNTRGVTIVISPLLSLMEDQVAHLKELGVQAFLINSETPREDRDGLMNALWSPDAEKFIQLLYVTPEMLGKSEKILKAFEGLQRRKKLARLVIDEAHCVSQWGHDFRPDYKNIGEVRKRLPGVPVMALTATATQRVKVDTQHHLGITGCAVFTRSFNRDNLYYEVRAKPKGKEDVISMAELIKNEHHKQTGIIYCLSRKNCEDIAKALAKNHGIKANHYHAGLDSAARGDVQRQWQAGKVHVIVATIAFGMGIDKSNVRFVIHHSIPKSLEGYYQETGRAGRDGKPSKCYLFYGYQDAGKLRRMIDDPSNEGSREQKGVQHDMLKKMVQYCENRSDCRRAQVLHYFGERFDREDCLGTCDNCNSNSTFKEVDFTREAQLAVDLVSNVRGASVTLLHCIDVFRGASNKKIKDLGHDKLDEFGAGKGIERGDIERLFSRLLNEGAIVENNVVNKRGFAQQYVNLGRRCNEFRGGRATLKMDVHATPRLAKAHNDLVKKSKKVETRGPRRVPQSTNISSPIPAASKRKKPSAQPQINHGQTTNGYEMDGFVVGDCPDDSFENLEDELEDGSEDDFEPILVARGSRHARSDLAPPITNDDELDSLDDIHRDLVDNFVLEAEKKSKILMTKRGLREQPFPSLLLRRMFIHFTVTEEEMLRIPGIDPERVRLWGKIFIKLVQKAQDKYKEVMGEAEAKHGQNIIDLVSDDEYGDDDYGSFEEEVNEEEVGEASHFFHQPDREVAAFNSRFSQTANKPKARSQPAMPPPRKPYKARGGGASSRSRGGHSKRRSASGSGYGSRSTSAGTSGPRKTTSRSRGGSGASSSRGSGRFGGSGISMMPT
jgi:bloom syndrome protein